MEEREGELYPLSLRELRMVFKGYSDMVNRRLTNPKLFKDDINYLHMESEILNMHVFLNDITDLLQDMEYYAQHIIEIESNLKDEDD